MSSSNGKVREGGDLAIGFLKGRKLKVVVGFDGDQFAEVKAFAAQRRVSFAEAVRLLCEWGMEAA